MNIILYYYMHHIILPGLYLSYIAINSPFEIVYISACSSHGLGLWWVSVFIKH